MAGRWHGTNGSGWGFNSKQYAPYVSGDDIYSLIQKFDKKVLSDFSAIELIKLASFFLNYGKDDMDYVNEQDAMTLVEKWENS